MLLARGATRQRELRFAKPLALIAAISFINFSSKALCWWGWALPAGYCSTHSCGGTSVISAGCRLTIFRRIHFQSDRGLFFYAFGAALVTLLLSSLLPAIRSSRSDLGLVMKQGEPVLSIRRWNLRNGFVGLQLTLSVVLLSLGVLFARSFTHLADTNPGFNITGTVIARVFQPPGQPRGEAGWALAGSRRSGDPASTRRQQRWPSALCRCIGPPSSSRRQ